MSDFTDADRERMEKWCERPDGTTPYNAICRLFDSHTTLRARVAELEAERDRLSAQLRARGLSPAPCDVCGYNGPGYYQPETHPCAAPVAAQDARDAVPLDALVCVGRAQFPQRGGNAGLSWHVVDALGDTEGFRSGSPCNKELLFVIPAQFKRAAILAAKEEKR